MKHDNIGYLLIILIIILVFLLVYRQENVEYFQDNNKNIYDINMNIDEYIYDNYIIWTMTSDGYTDITHNLYKSLEKANIPWKLLNICVDDESFKYFNDKKMPCIRYNNNINTKKGELSKYGSDDFMSFNRIKLDLLHYFSKNSIDKIKYVVYIDGDIIVSKDFIPYLQQLYQNEPNNYFYLQCDEQGKVTSTTCSNLCTGFISFKKEKIFKSPFNVYDEEKWKSIREDQPWVNIHLKEYKIPTLSLDQDLFPNGTYIEGNTSGIINKLNNDRYILHYNWLVGNEKIQKMKENNNWYL